MLRFPTGFYFYLISGCRGCVGGGAEIASGFGALFFPILSMGLDRNSSKSNSLFSLGGDCVYGGLTQTLLSHSSGCLPGFFLNGSLNNYSRLIFYVGANFTLFSTEGRTGERGLSNGSTFQPSFLKLLGGSLCTYFMGEGDPLVLTIGEGGLGCYCISSPC